MNKVSKTVLFLAVSVILALPNAAFAGAATTSVTIKSIYMNPVGNVIVVWLNGSGAVNPVTSCGSTFSGAYAVLVPDYSTTAKAEGTKQAYSMLMSAYLSGKAISFYSQGCTADIWGGASKFAVIYDLSY